MKTAFGQVTFQAANGKVYENAIVYITDDHSLCIKHGGNRISLPYSHLSAETREALGLNPLVLARHDFKFEIDSLKNTLRLLDYFYEEHLVALREDFREKGNLDAVLAVEEDLKKSRSGKFTETQYPRIKRSREVYIQESRKLRNQSVDHLKDSLEKYRSNLMAIQKRMTVESDLDAMVKVRMEEKKVTGMLGDLPETLQTLVIPGPADQGSILDRHPDSGAYFPFDGLMRSWGSTND